MKTEKKLYFVVVLIITALIFKQHWALNAFVISIISIAYLYIFNNKSKNKTWWLSAFIWLGSGLSIFLSHTYTGTTLFFITGFNFIAINFNQTYSFPYSLIHSFFSMIVGLASFVTPKIKPNNEYANSLDAQTKSDSKVLKKLFLYGIPFILVIVFLKLYQLANPKFAEITEFLSLEFINWNFIILYVLLLFVLYGILLFKQYKISEDWDLKTPNTINSEYTDSIQDKIGLEIEYKMASITLIILNILLLAFLITDGYTIFTSNINSELTHSENVHQGINILITSIVLVIFIIGFIFRGALNFKLNKGVKILASIWIIFNVVITAFNTIKIYNYIDEWGLTHKRIGVYTYLFLCIIGLSLTFYKIWNQKSFTFLVRRASYSFVSFLVLFSLINWNSIIVNYNLNDEHFSTNKIDFYYNYSLGYEAFPALANYFRKHPESNVNIYERLDYNIVNHKSVLDSGWLNFPSLKWSVYLAENKLKNYKPLLNNTYKPYSVWDD